MYNMDCDFSVTVHCRLQSNLANALSNKEMLCFGSEISKSKTKKYNKVFDELFQSYHSS